MATSADAPEPTRAQIDALPGPVVVEFGAGWCGYCRAIRPQVSKLLAEFPQVRHLVVEDGPGQPLGRSFGVKLWPTFVFLRDGQITIKAVRPAIEQVRQGFVSITLAG